MIKIILNGCNGRMGKTISELAKGYSNSQITAGIDKLLLEKVMLFQFTLKYQISLGIVM